MLTSEVGNAHGPHDGPLDVGVPGMMHAAERFRAAHCYTGRVGGFPHMPRESERKDEGLLVR